MSVQLLDKTRKIGKLLHNNNSNKVVFNDICKVLGEILESNILVISKKGKILGIGTWPGVDEIEELIDEKLGGFVDKMLNERLLSILSTKENVNLATLGFAEEYVKKYCETREIPFEAKKVDIQAIAKIRKNGTEEAGREERYKFFNEVLEKYHGTKVATAHTKNDNCETVLMNMIRGTGISRIKRHSGKKR